jgi:hypothetical protein
MGGFRRAFLGYRRSDVDTEMAARGARAWALERDAQEAMERWREASEAAAELEREVGTLSEMVIEREREIRGLAERLHEANDRHDRSILSLESISARLEEIHTQARGQATRIRMKALHDAVEVSRRAQDLARAEGVESSGVASSANGAAETGGEDLFEGLVKVEIGPLGDFSQLVNFEDAVGQVGASEISVERFSEGRATLSMRLDEPVELLRELEERSPLEFHVRRTADDNLILDVDEDQGPDQRAA